MIFPKKLPSGISCSTTSGRCSMVLPSNWKLIVPTTRFSAAGRAVQWCSTHSWLSGLSCGRAEWSGRRLYQRLTTHDRCYQTGQVLRQILYPLSTGSRFRRNGSPSQQFFTFGFSAFIGATTHNGGDQTHLAFGCGCNEVIASLIGVTGFDTVDIQAVIPQQAVAV